LTGFIITGFSYDLPDGTTITPPDGLAGDDIELGSTTLRLRGDSLENVRLEVVIDDITIDSADDGLVIYNDVTIDSTEFNIEVDGKAILLTDIEITNTQVGSIVFAGFTIQEDIALGDTTVDDITVVDDEIASDLFGGFWDDVWPF